MLLRSPAGAITPSTPDAVIISGGGGPGSYADGLSSTYGWQIFTGVNGTDPGLDGVCYVRSTVKLKEVIDGLSHTYLVAEKYLAPDFYNNGDAGSDNESLYSGFDNDNFRISGWLGGYGLPTAIVPATTMEIVWKPPSRVLERVILRRIGSQHKL